MLKDYFDNIYCVNLRRRPDKRAEAIARFKGMDVEFYDAVDGMALDNIPPSLNPGELGCVMSHLNIYQDAINRGFGTYLILEDDCEFAEDMLDNLGKFMSEVPDDWSLLYFGGNHNSIPLNMVSEHVHKLVRTYTTHCYAVRAGFGETLLEEIKINNETKQVDVELSDVQKKYPCYGFTPHQAWQVDGFSDISNAQTDYRFLRTHGDPTKNGQ